MVIANEEREAPNFPVEFWIVLMWAAYLHTSKSLDGE